jgi:hypothetical protein
MKYTLAMALLVFTTSVSAQDLTASAVIETDAVEAQASTPGDLSSQRIRGAAALNAGCATTETYETTLGAEDVVDFVAEDCQAELVVADPAEEIDETEASATPVEDYPTKEK